MLQIGEVATRVGLSLRTLRHWDDVGLVVPSARSAGGFRLYTDDDVTRLLLVKTLKPLELTLDQIRELISLIDAARTGVDQQTGDDAETPENVRSRLAIYRAATDARVEAVRAQLHGLESLSRELRSLSTATRTDRSTAPPT